MAGILRAAPPAHVHDRTRRLLTTAQSSLALLISLTGIASAQSLTGTVNGAGRPIVGASVRILELDRVDRTRPGGRFAFSNIPRGRYQVFVNVIGYASASHLVEVTAEGASTSFNLRESVIQLNEIVVSGSPYARTADEQYLPAESKSQVEFENGAGSSFAEKISDLPGVAVRGLGSAPSRPVLRGLSDNRILILENGLRTGDIATYDPAHATPIEAMGISEIDVVRGPAAILYGPTTIGGLVNVMTNIVPMAADRRVSGTVAAEGNSVSDQAAGYFNTVFSAGQQAFRVSAGGLHAQDIRIPSGSYTAPASGVAFHLDRMPQTFDHSHEEGLGYSYQGNFGMIGVGGKHYEMNYGIPGIPANPDWAKSPPTTSRIAQRRNTFEVRGLLIGGDAFVKQWRLNANYNDYNHSEFPTAQDATGVSDPQANHFHKQAFNAALQLQHRPVGQLQGTLGLWTNIENLTIDGDQPLGPNSLTTGFAGYAFEEYLAGANTRLQAGLRFDYNKIQTKPSATSTDSVFQILDVSRLSNAVTGSLGLIKRFTPELSGSVNIARSFRAPTVQELFANGLDAPSGTYSIGGAGLEPETGIGLDASLRGDFANVAFEVSPYANIMKNYIYGFLRGDTILAFPVRQFAATDARLIGFEASIMVQPVKNIAIKANSDYVNAEDTQLKVPLPFTPPLRGLLRGTYQNDRYMAMIEGRFADRQSRLGDGDTPTSGYGVMNLGVGIRLVQVGLVHHIALHCDNVFDRVYRDHLSVIKDFVPQPGRGFRLNYELAF